MRTARECKTNSCHPRLSGYTPYPVDTGQDQTPLKDPDATDLPPSERPWPFVWQKPFLETLTLMPDVSAACRLAGIGRARAYELRSKDAAFSSAWDEALELARDFVQRRAHEWITQGVPVRSTRTKTKRNAKGELIEEEVIETVSAERSATLMIFWLKAWYPDRYRWAERSEVSTPEGGSLRIESVETIDQQIAALTAEIEARRRQGVGQDEPAFEPERSG